MENENSRPHRIPKFSLSGHSDGDDERRTAKQFSKGGLCPYYAYTSEGESQIPPKYTSVNSQFQILLTQAQEHATIQFGIFHERNNVLRDRGRDGKTVPVTDSQRCD